MTQTVTEAVARREDTAPPAMGEGVLTLRADQEWWTPKQIAALKALGIKNATNEDLLVFFHHCMKTGLDPFARQIYLLERRSWNKQTREWEYHQTIQVGIDGFRVNAQRAALRQGINLEYEDTVWFDDQAKRHEVWLDDENPPAAALVTVVKVLSDGTKLRVPGLAKFESFAAYGKDKDGNRYLMSQWGVMPDHMIAKCFRPDTEVLTDKGFMRLPDVTTERIAQVTDHGLEFVEAKPFAQRYDGPMIAHHGERLSFSVTPSHDMITTQGRVEAGAMLATSTTGEARWRIPMTAPGRKAEAPVSDEALRLAGIFMADGYAQGGRLLVSVSRPRKVSALESLGLHYDTKIKRDAGRVSGGPRPVVTRTDKTTFLYRTGLLDGTGVTTGKAVDPDAVLGLSQRQARILIDGWAEFDGHRQGPTVRVRTSRPEHVGAIELLAVAAGYTVSIPRKRHSDLSDRVSYDITLSATRSTAPVKRPSGRRPGVVTEPNADGWVWCVTVPSHAVVARLDGMSMVVGQCAEAFALRRAFPQDLGGMYIEEELQRTEEGPRGMVVSSYRRDPSGDDDGTIDGETAEAEARRKAALGAIMKTFRAYRLGGKDHAQVRRSVLSGLAADDSPQWYIDHDAVAPDTLELLAQTLANWVTTIPGQDNAEVREQIIAYAQSMDAQIAHAEEQRQAETEQETSDDR